MIDKLEYVVALAREKHFGRAADLCGVTQPTLSAGLKQLEDTLGILIVQRSSRFLGFTPEGERVLAWARRMVGDAQAMRQEIKALKHGLSGHLRIAAIPSALPIVAGLTTGFAQRHPAVRFSVMSRTSDDILRKLENFEIDAGVTYIDNESLTHVRMLPLYYERYRYVTARISAPPRDDTIAWRSVGERPLCLLTRDMQNRRIIDKVSQAAGITLSPRLETDSMIVLLSHVKTGFWSSILPAALVDLSVLPADIVALPIVGPELANLIGLVVPDRNPMTTLVQALFAETTQRPSAAETA
ncbi:LysR family transcriptional regulator [Lichenihabitans psoromatis]|uniref:LysR family transcriptional regulator n=1 Tax=Lichenihabitans psoromatis TaxID=2528642 RepID=UPI001036E5AD|nr:LysR family transcriptional regulator [Lichenihabitans psoromatis]